MSGFGQAAAVVGQATVVASTIGSLAGSVAALAGGALGFIGGYGGIAPGLGIWAIGLQPASWNGIPFAVKVAPIRRGRKVAVHEYPFSDDVWVEDLGLATRAISFSGFLIGDDVYPQRDAMVAAVETPGAGVLVHPSLGAMSATLVEFSAAERADLGRVVEIELSFIASGQNAPQYPSTALDTQDATDSAATDTDAASGADFGDDVGSAIATGASAVAAGAQTAAAFGATAVGLIGDAAGVAGAVQGMAGVVGRGYYGRYNGANLIVPPVLVTPIPPGLGLVAATSAATASLLAASVAAVANVGAAASGLGSLAAGL